jgi:tetratricopeptide (TPR) repeat protein
LESPPVSSSPAYAGPLQLAAAEGQGDFRLMSGSPYGDYLAGLIAGKQRDLSAAADLMLRALDNDPENAALLRHTFTLVAADGRHAEAVRLARRVVEHFPDDSSARLVLAVDKVERGEVEAAAEALNSLPDRGLSKFMVPMLDSWLLVAKGEVDAAVERLAALGENDGFGALYRLQLALLYDVAGRSDAAEAEYRAALQAAGQPSLRLTWLAGNYFERQGQAEAADQTYMAFLGSEPANTFFDQALRRVADGVRPLPSVPDHKAGMAEVLFNLASLLSQERAEETALIHSHLALRLNPRFDVARILLGEILESQDRVPEAIEVYRRVDPASPFSWMARLRIAEGFEDLERVAEAVAELEALAAERPERYEPLFRVGNILRAQERFSESVTAYDRAFDRLPGGTTGLWTMYYFRGISLERAGDWARAEQDLLKALELEPEQPYVMNYLAYSWVEKKVHLDEAEQMLVQAVELRPEDGYIVDSLGWVYYRLEQFDNAVIHLERAVELRPQDPVINDHLGDAYWRVGRHQEARFQWRRALSLKPEADLVPTIEVKIEDGLGANPQKI